jgi:DNA-binding MarR family transcriptional regulator
LAEHGLTPGVYRLLDHVHDRPGVAPAAAADALGVARPTVTAWIIALDELGLLRRLDVPADGRRATLEPTAEGQRVVAAARDLIRRRQNRLLSGAIDPVEQASLLDVLQRIATAGS